jgi:hypothetical protein
VRPKGLHAVEMSPLLQNVFRSEARRHEGKLSCRLKMSPSPAKKVNSNFLGFSLLKSGIYEPRGLVSTLKVSNFGAMQICFKDLKWTEYCPEQLINIEAVVDSKESEFLHGKTRNDW